MLWQKFRLWVGPVSPAQRSAIGRKPSLGDAAQHRGCLCPSIIPDMEMLNWSWQQILRAQPTLKIFIAITAILLPYVPASCKHFRKMRSILNSHPGKKEVHSSSTPQFLGRILTDFLPGFFFFNRMLFIKKKKSSEMLVSVRHRKLVRKTLSKNTGM